jgi:hypothetical protein
MHIKLTILAGASLACMPFVATAQTTPPPTEQPAQPQPDEPATTDQQAAPDQAQQPPADEPATQEAQPPADQAQQPAAQAEAGATAKATAADLKAGVSVYDSAGQLVGKIESSDAEGGVVDTGTVKAKLPLASFGHNDKGLVISMTKTELEAAAKEKSPQ